MKTQVTFRHVKTHHPKLQEEAIELAESFEKYHDGIISSNVEFINENEKSVIITVHVQGTTLVAKEDSDDFHKSLKEAADKIIRQIIKWKEKHNNTRAKGVE
jgi:ribosomal subunit interface protein